MPVHVFSLVLNRLPEPGSDDVAAPGDLTFGCDGGLPIAQFDREAETLGEAIYSALKDLQRWPNLYCCRVVDEDLVTLADIGHRAGASRETFRRYAAGKRGPGYFPAPVAPGRSGAAFYRWTEVSAWVHENLGASIAVDRYAETLAYANLLVQARNLRGPGGGDPLLELIRAGLPALS